MSAAVRRAVRRLLLDDKALAVLEFPAIRERLARETSFAAGRELALALRPVADRERAVRRQRETAEAVRLRTLRVDVGMGGVRDVRPSAQAAGRGQVLTPSELLEIAELARASTRLRRTFARTRQETPLLSTLAAGLADLEALRGLIAAAVDERGEVRDSASRELQAIRRERDAVHARLQQRMEALLRSASLRPSLQDPIVTLRDGRYVLPVRAEARSRRARHRARQLRLRRDDLRRAARRDRPRQPLARAAGAGAPRDRAHHAHALRGRRRGRARAGRRRRAPRAARPRAGEGASRRAPRRGRPDRGGERRALARRGARRAAAGRGAAPRCSRARSSPSPSRRAARRGRC